LPGGMDPLVVSCHHDRLTEWREMVEVYSILGGD
jgi:hypothetical protein